MEKRRVSHSAKETNRHLTILSLIGRSTGHCVDRYRRPAGKFASRDTALRRRVPRSVLGSRSPVAMPVQPQVGPWVGVLQVRGCSLIKRKILSASPDSFTVSLSPLIVALRSLPQKERKKGRQKRRPRWKEKEGETEGEKGEKESGQEGERGREREQRGLTFTLATGGRGRGPKGVHQAARLAGTLRERHARTPSFPFSSSLPASLLPQSPLCPHTPRRPRIVFLFFPISASLAFPPRSFSRIRAPRSTRRRVPRLTTARAFSTCSHYDSFDVRPDRPGERRRSKSRSSQNVERCARADRVAPFRII